MAMKDYYPTHTINTEYAVTVKTAERDAGPATTRSRHGLISCDECITA